MRNGLRIIDADGHAMEPPGMWERYVADEFKATAPRAHGEYLVEVAGRFMPNTQDVPAEAMRQRVANAGKAPADERFRDAWSRGYDPRTYFEAMDREGIDIMFLYPTQGLYAISVDGMDAGLVGASCTAYNNWLSEFCKVAPDRLIGVALVNLYDVEDARREARRAVRDLGMKALFIRPNLHNGRPIHDEYYWPLYEEAEKLGVPLSIHEGCGSYLPYIGRERFHNTLMQHTICHPAEQMSACIGLICGGVLERFPTLQVAFLESGSSWLPYLLWRMDEHYEWRGKEDAPDLTMMPSQYFHRQCYISTECDEELVASVIDSIGDDRIVWASDYPHPDAKFPGAVEAFLQLPRISDESRRKILWDNPCRLYGLDVESGVSKAAARPDVAVH